MYFSLGRALALAAGKLAVAGAVGELAAGVVGLLDGLLAGPFVPIAAAFEDVAASACFATGRAGAAVALGAGFVGATAPSTGATTGQARRRGSLLLPAARRSRCRARRAFSPRVVTSAATAMPTLKPSAARGGEPANEVGVGFRAWDRARRRAWSKARGRPPRGAGRSPRRRASPCGSAATWAPPGRANRAPRRVVLPFRWRTRSALSGRGERRGETTRRTRSAAGDRGGSRAIPRLRECPAPLGREREGVVGALHVVLPG